MRKNGSEFLAFIFMAVAVAACTTTSTPNTENSPVANSAKSENARMPANHSWGNYHWARTSSQFTLKAGDNLTTTAWKSRLAQAATDWNSPQSVGGTTTPVIVAVTAGMGRRKCAMVSGTTQICNAKYGNNGWLGLASINIVNGEHITQGTAKMNDSYFETPTYNNINEREHVMCQEMAHTFGLGHQSEDGSSQNSCMDYFSNTGSFANSTASTTPNLHDFEQLGILYGHLDSSTTVSPYTVASSLSDVDDSPQSWGRFMSEISRGRHGYYEKANQDGSLTVTHVYWTSEAAGKCKDCDHRER